MKRAVPFHVKKGNRSFFVCFNVQYRRTNSTTLPMIWA